MKNSKQIIDNVIGFSILFICWTIGLYGNRGLIMIKFYLVNFKTKFKSFDIVLIGSLDQVKTYSEQFAFNYGSDYYIEQEHEQLTPEMSGIEIKNVCNH